MHFSLLQKTVIIKQKTNQVLNNLCIKIQIKVNFCILSFIFDWIINYENKTKIQFKKKNVYLKSQRETKRDISHPVSVASNLEDGNKFQIYEYIVYIPTDIHMLGFTLLDYKLSLTI